jgi:hypothetical protein
MWKLGTKAEEFPVKEYINGIFVAVHPISQLICGNFI